MIARTTPERPAEKADTYRGGSVGTRAVSPCNVGTPFTITVEAVASPASTSRRAAGATTIVVVPNRRAKSWNVNG